jgi:hypothetical protein
MNKPQNAPQIPDENAGEKLQIKAVKKTIKAHQTEFENRAAQDKHEAALASYQTKRQGSMNISLAGIPMTDAEIAALDKDEERKTP